MYVYTYKVNSIVVFYLLCVQIVNIRICYIYMWWMPLQNDLDTHIKHMIKKIGFYKIIFPEIARTFVLISPHSAYRAFCGEMKIKFVTNLWKIIL